MVEVGGGIILGGLTVGALGGFAIVQAPSSSEGITLPSRTAQFFVNFPGPPVGGTGFYAKGDGSVGTYRNILDDGTGNIQVRGTYTGQSTAVAGTNLNILAYGTGPTNIIRTDGFNTFFENIIGNTLIGNGNGNVLLAGANFSVNRSGAINILAGFTTTGVGTFAQIAGTGTTPVLITETLSTISFRSSPSAGLYLILVSVVCKANATLSSLVVTYADPSTGGLATQTLATSVAMTAGNANSYVALCSVATGTNITVQAQALALNSLYASASISAL